MNRRSELQDGKLFSLLAPNINLSDNIKIGGPCLMNIVAVSIQPNSLLKKVITLFELSSLLT